MSHDPKSPSVSSVPAAVENREASGGVGSGGSSARLEALRLRLCAVGLHPGYHDTPEKAADAVVEMIAYFRAELANPPADVCGLVMEKYGVEGFTGDKPARCRLVSLPNAGSEPPRSNT